MRTRNRSRQAFNGSVDRGTIIAQHDINGKTRTAGADHEGLAQKINAARDRRCDISECGIYLQPIVAGADAVQHEIVVVGFARCAKISSSRRIEVVGGLEKDVSLHLAREFSGRHGPAGPAALLALLISYIHRNRSARDDRHGGIGHRGAFHSHVNAAVTGLLAPAHRRLHGVGPIRQHALDARFSTVAQRVSRPLVAVESDGNIEGGSGIDIRNGNFYPVVRLKNRSEFDLSGFAGFEGDGGSRSKIAGCRVVDRRISEELAAGVEGDGIAVQQFVGEDFVSSCREIGETKLSIGARGGTRDRSPERAPVSYIASVGFHADAVGLVRRGEIHPADDEGFWSERDRHVGGGA